MQFALCGVSGFSIFRVLNFSIFVEAAEQRSFLRRARCVGISSCCFFVPLLPFPPPTAYTAPLQLPNSRRHGARGPTHTRTALESGSDESRAKGECVEGHLSVSLLLLLYVVQTALARGTFSSAAVCSSSTAVSFYTPFYRWDVWAMMLFTWC